jgi:anaerobic magnesium-protoporphyrin IX monomethyl ester cyclase
LPIGCQTNQIRNMQKVLLINTNNTTLPYPVPPVGLCLLASQIEDKFNVIVYDGTFGVLDELYKLVTDFNPDYIGFGIRNIDDMVYDKQTVYFEKIRDDYTAPVRKITDATFILGGSGFSIYPETLLEYLGIDLGIVGEAEESFPRLLEHLENGKDLSGLEGIVIRNKKLHKSTHSKKQENLSLPFANIDHFISFDPYRNKGAYSIQTKRGCYHKCIYCTYPVIEGSNYKIRDPKKVADEIEQAYNRLGNVTFEFVDSTFNDPPGHAESICHEIIKKGIRPRLRTMGINPRNSSKELFDLMMKAGFSQIDCTPDSASPKMLKNLKKNFTLNQLIKTANLIKVNKMPTMWFFLFGGPGENEETFAETFDFIDKYISPEDMVHMTAGLRIYPGTHLHKVAIREGILNPEDNLLNPVYYVSPELGMEKLNNLINEAASKRHFCVPSNESAPPKEMMMKALEIQSNISVKEPMFRTLLRLRKEMMDNQPLH